MKNSVLISYLFALLSFLMAADSGTKAQTVTGSIDKGVVSRGDTAKGRLVMTIPGGLHVNSNRPSSQYAIATTVRVTAAGVRLGPVMYPRGKNRRFQFSDEPINVYEGSTVFRFAIRIPETFRGNTIRVRASVRYQACTDEVCYPPRSKDVILTALVR